MTRTEINDLYAASTGQSLREQDMVLVTKFADAVEKHVEAIHNIKIEALRGELETERMRLAACGVVALSDTPESAKRHRQMLPEYMSESCKNVIRRVDECMALREKVAQLDSQVAWLSDQGAKA
jgi:hypothetical protein